MKRRWPSLLVLAGCVVLSAAPSVGQCNTAPVAVDDSAETYSTPVLIDVLANDSDADGEALSITFESKTCAGVVSIDFDLLTFTPSAGLVTSCTIDYRVWDEGGLSALATITVGPLDPLIFADGFESGDTSAWSDTVGGAR